MKGGIMALALFTFFLYLAATGRLQNIITIITNGKVTETPAK